jgi:2-methylaconitate isomerase
MIETRFLDPGGAVFRRLLPTGAPCDTITFEGATLDVSVVDVANPTIFVAAADLGLAGDEHPADVNADLDLLARLERLRGSLAVRLDMVGSPQEAATVTPSLPTVTLVSAPADPDADLRIRVMSVQRMHHASPMSALMCTASAAAISGTVVSRFTGSDGRLTVEHPKGLTTATAQVEHSTEGPIVRAAGVTRTARRLMAGEVYVRA